MLKYLALLRGINVGGNKKVEMPKLKKVFESLGYTNVSTYINTGNVIFEMKDSVSSVNRVNSEQSSKIENALEKSFGFEIKTIVKNQAQIQKICEVLPSDWQNNTEQKTDVLFLWDAFDKRGTLDLIKINPVADTLKYVPGAIIWNVNKKFYNKTGMKKFIGTEIYKNMTARNINTVRKLGEMMK